MIREKVKKDLSKIGKINIKLPLLVLYVSLKTIILFL
jgi:hypothetical protein